MLLAKPRTLPRTSYSYRSAERCQIHSVSLGALRRWLCSPLLHH
jgi:hypothetical protein